MLTADELAEMRATQTETMSEACDILRKTLSADGAGGVRESEAVAATTVCRIGISGRSPQERMIAAQLGSVVVYTLAFPAPTDVRNADVISVGTRRFEVAGVLDGTDAMETARRAVCVEVGR